MNGSKLTLEVLTRHGVDTVFGYPGGAIMPLYDALVDSEVKHYLCRHEQGAAFSALGYSKASGKVGVCFATSGPGVTNLITGLADATADSVPVVAITGQVTSHLMGTDAFQEIDVLGLSLAVTKHAFQVTDVEELESTLHKAFEIASSGRPGAVIVDIPKDIQLAQVTSKPMLVGTNDLGKANDESIQGAVSLLHQAKKPMLYVGGGVSLGNAVSELRMFANKTGMPSVSTLKGLGAADPNDSAYLGMIGMHGTKASNLAVQECDLLMAVGARFDDRVTGKLAEFAPHAKVIHLDVDKAEVNKLRSADVTVLGDFKHSLPKLLNALDSNLLDIEAWRNHCQEMSRDFGFKYLDNRDNSTGDIDPTSMLNQLSQMMPSDAVVTTDVGQHQMWVAQHMSFGEPKNLLTSGALGTMGFGLPAAIGAQLSRPNDCVIAVSGDGSFMMNVQEMGTIKRFGLPLKILLIDNTKLGMVRQWQSLFFDQRFSETDLSDNPDFVRLASAFDIEAETITEPKQVAGALEKMLNSKKAYLLHVRINEDQNVWPLVPPNTANQAMLEG
ncbi:acetolactate synthase 2 catalytic subunit [Aliikangiella coralliicola]|uniref:Acetolactate synthase n=1 Tax=Aliikangiella coralliicola TaxID=2592383 RepID=A0A545U7M2_9GAMM|nr:acetolactate synthase 2 catalytic subunit [Aliikangiella coralliicola]TQV85461.1 acetolactate synthase 2 catalytic subunit [Aliikangiella coralliicola]